jgi:hypothetical protein
MKHVLVFVILAFVSSSIALCDNIKLESVIYKGEDFDRSIIVPDVTVELHRQQLLLEVSLCNIGDALITLVDSNGNVVNEVIVNAKGNATTLMNLPSIPGMYSIVISSDSYYAVGEFLL